MTRFIDPPDMLSGTLQDWQEFLAEMEAISPKDNAVRNAIAMARRVIADKTPLQS
jgi:heme oxygenase